MCSTGPIPGSSSHLQCYITCGIPKWKGGWHGRSDQVNRRWLGGGGGGREGGREGGKYSVFRTYENKFSSEAKINRQSLCEMFIVFFSYQLLNLKYKLLVHASGNESTCANRSMKPFVSIPIIVTPSLLHVSVA